MKVVINTGIGGFGLSNEAAELCIQRGIALVKPGESRWNERVPALSRFEILDEISYDCDNADDRPFRSHPVVVGVVEELGKAANGENAELAILEIPFSEPFGWHVHEFEDGREIICEDHRRWYWHEGETATTGS